MATPKQQAQAQRRRTIILVRLVVGVFIMLILVQFGLVMTRIIPGLEGPFTTVLYFLTSMLMALLILLIARTSRAWQKALQTSMHQAELERQRTITLVNNLSHGVLSIDSQGLVRTYNAAVLNILDTNTAPTGRPLDDILKLHTGKGQPVRLFADGLRSNTHYSRDDVYYHYQDDEDDKAQLEVLAAPIVTGRWRDVDQGFIIQLRDITKQKSLEEEKDEFISVVSHELRTPLAIAEGALSNLQLMYRRPGQVSRSLLKQSLGSAHEQIKFLAGMVNDLSTLSRAERNQASETKAINVSELLASLQREYQPQAAQQGLELTVDAPDRKLTINHSRLYITELLQNFITNALKYTNQGQVTLASYKQAGQVVLSVKDTGIGISAADQRRIFEKFYRSEDYRTRENRGTGLGLYVATKLARKMNGHIEVQSRLNRGSEFRLVIPPNKAKLGSSPNKLA